MRRTVIVLIYFLLPGFSFADPVSDFVHSFIKKTQIPGVAILVRQNDKIVRSEGFGLANVELAVPVKPQTVFQSGSVGKQFTATAVMLLVDDHKLTLDDPVSKYLSVPATWEAITIRHLLTHTSGLGDYPEDFSVRKDYTEEDLLKMITRQKLLFKPGEKWRYSNLGYITLGILIGKVAHQFYGDFLHHRVFVPLKMKTTRIINEADIIPNRAAGYEMHGDVIKNQEWASPSVNTTADGALYFTVEDLAKWDEGLESEAILSHTSYQQMLTPVRLNDGTNVPYGFGWDILKTESGHKLIEHAGGWQGFTAHIARYVDDRLTVIVLCNNASGDTTFMAHKIAGFYNSELAPPQRVAKQIDPKILNNLTGKYRWEDGFTITFSVEGNQLIAERSGQKHELFAESETTFFREDSEVTYEFVKDANGKFNTMIFSQGWHLTLNRID